MISRRNPVLAVIAGHAANPAPALSQASDGMAIAGQVLTIVQNQNVEIGESLTTAIGALNAGSVKPRSAP